MAELHLIEIKVTIVILKFSIYVLFYIIIDT